MSLSLFIYKSINKLLFILGNIWNKMCTYIIFICNNVKHRNFRTGGIPYIMVERNSKGISIGENFAMNNGIKYNPIGIPQPCSLVVYIGGSIKIGNNVGISQTALVAHNDITIGDNVKIGGGCCIYTSDFHSLDPKIRRTKEDCKNRKTAPVHIGNDVFIGAHSIILKGVSIGDNSIIGAGSVVTKSIPENQIWAGNPAIFIRNI